MKLTKAFFDEIRTLIQAAHATVAKGVDLVQVHTNFEIGRRISEQEQQGKGRAAYGEEVIAALAERLTAEFGRGFSTSRLAYMRSFFLVYQDRTRIFQSLIGKSGFVGRRPFALSWTHYVFLLGIKSPDERSFYEIEATSQDWTVRELKRQFVEMGTLGGFPNPPAMVRSRRSRLAPHATPGPYERLALSRDKKGIRRLARKGHVVDEPRDLLARPHLRGARRRHGVVLAP
jgi:hypothetical protein